MLKASSTCNVIRAFSSVSGRNIFTPLFLDPALVTWRQGGTRNKKILFWGDSTTAGPSPPWADIANKAGTNFGGAGQQLDGVVLQNGGEIGATLTNAMNNTSTFNINWLLTQTFDLVVICFGINDVRQGAVNAAGISTLLTSAVNQIHTSKPNANIVLWTPNSFLSTDPTSSGYVVPLASAQTYTDALWNGYNNVVGNWPTFVAHVDKQQIYGRTCQPTSPLMQDIIHPDTNTGYTASLKALCDRLIPRGYPFNVAMTNDVFLTENVLTLNGDSLVDARGRHVLTAAAGTVTASGGWLNFDGASGLKILDNLADFNYGICDGGANDTARVTVDIQIISPVRAQSNGQYFTTNGNLQLDNDPSPNYTLQVFGALTASGGSPLVTGSKVDIAFAYSHDRYSTYLNGVQTSIGYQNADFTAGGSAALFIGQATDAWAAVFFQGQMRLRITRENRYNHNATYTPYPGTWPTS